MENSPHLWQKIKEKRNLTKLASGQDSHVFYEPFPLNKKRTKRVVKVYEDLAERIKNPDLMNEILNTYRYDTKKIHDFLKNNPNPLDQNLIVGNERYDLLYEVTKKGTLDFKINDSDDAGTDFSLNVVNEIPAVYGEKFIQEKVYPGEVEIYDYNSKKANSLPDKWQRVLPFINELFISLNEKFGTEFTRASMNLKIFLNSKDKKVHIVITDLAANIYDYFMKSSHLENLRKQYNLE